MISSIRLNLVEEEGQGVGLQDKTGIIKHRIVQKTQSLLIEKQWLTWGVFLFGIFIRIYNLDIRPLWRDEAWVALIASSNNLSSAFLNQWPVPPLFTSSLYLSVNLFKNNEFFLRIIPALFGIGGMGLIYYSVRRWFGKAEAVGALILFSCLPVLIAYSRELKQYSGDIFFGLLLILIAEYLIQYKYKPALWAVLAIAGVVGLWFSYTLIFVLISVGFITLLYIMQHITSSNISKREKYSIVLYWLGTFSIVLISFAILYFIVIRNQMNAELDTFWVRVGAFPNTEGIVPLLKWGILATWNFFIYFWNDYAYIVTPLSMLGIWELFRSGRSRIIFYWGIILFLILVASFFQAYPFGGCRVTLFTVPFFIILFVCGLKSLWKLSKIKFFWKPIAYSGLALLIVQVADATVYYKNNKGYFWYAQYPLTQDMKSALLLLEKERKENETLYVYYGSDLAFEYYSKFYYKKSFSPVLIGKMHRDNYPEYVNEISPLLEGKRTFWLLATHAIPDEVNYITKVLQTKWDYQARLYYSKNGGHLFHYTPGKKN